MSRRDELVGPTWAAIVQAVPVGYPLTYTQLGRVLGGHR